MSHKNFRELTAAINADPERRVHVDELKQQVEWEHEGTDENDPYFDLWLRLWTIEQESDSWLRCGGDARMVFDYIKDLAEMARAQVETLEPIIRPAVSHTEET